MEFINNIQKDSLIKFNIPDISTMLNKEEFLEYCDSILSITDGHLQLEYEFNNPVYPSYKINSANYCYIYLPRIIKSHIAEYYKKYLSIIKKVSTLNVRKYVLSIGIQQDKIINMIQLLYPFLDNEHTWNYKPMFEEHIVYSTKLIRTNYIQHLPFVPYTYPVVEIDEIPIKLKYNKLIIRCTPATLPEVRLIIEIPKIELYVLGATKAKAIEHLQDYLIVRYEFNYEGELIIIPLKNKLDVTYDYDRIHFSDVPERCLPNF